MGYNSSNYDLTMLAYYFTQAWQPGESGKRDRFSAVTAREMRDFNDELFSRYIGNMRLRLWQDKTMGLVAKNFQMSGRPSGKDGSASSASWGCWAGRFWKVIN